MKPFSDIYMPISNKSAVSEMLERLSPAQLQPHMLSFANFCPFKTDFHRDRSTETALLELLSDLSQQLVTTDAHYCLIGLDIFAAFNR